MKTQSILHVARWWALRIVQALGLIIIYLALLAIHCSI